MIPTISGRLGFRRLALVELSHTSVDRSTNATSAWCEAMLVTPLLILFSFPSQLNYSRIRGNTPTHLASDMRLQRPPKLPSTESCLLSPGEEGRRRPNFAGAAESNPPARLNPSTCPLPKPAQFHCLPRKTING